MNQIKVNTTTNSIYHSLFRLLETKSFDDISVNDICKESLVSRTTFYSYFEDKYTLVLFAFEQERKELGLIKGVDVQKNLLLFLKRIKNKRKVYKNLLVSHINRELRKMIANQLNDTIDYILEDHIEEEKRMIISTLYTGGITYVMMQWIEDDCITDEHLIAKTLWDEIPIQR